MVCLCEFPLPAAVISAKLPQIFDASATYYRNCRPHLSLVEVKMGLPCSTEHWEAGSAQAWAALHPWTASAPSSLSFRDTINQLFEEDRSSSDNSTGVGGAASISRQTALEKIPDEFHRMLVSTTLVRTVWDLREYLNEPALSSVGPLGYSVFPKSMDAVLSVLDSLTTSALAPAAASMRRGSREHRTSPRTERELRGLVLRARISLIAQIIAADGITDHLSQAWSRQRTASEATEQRLIAWARADPVQPRKLVYVGARLLAISRLYPYNYPREPFDALQGGMLVWSMLRLLRKISGQPRQQIQTPPRLCQLDWLGHENAPEIQATRDWIEKGGEGYILRMHGVSDLGTPEGENQVMWETADVLRGMQVWGVAKSYLEMVTRALHSGD